MARNDGPELTRALQAGAGLRLCFMPHALGPHRLTATVKHLSKTSEIPHMKRKKPRWLMLALLALLALPLAALILPPLPKPKVRASRITGVNNISSFAMTAPNTNTLPNATINK